MNQNLLTDAQIAVRRSNWTNSLELIIFQKTARTVSVVQEVVLKTYSVDDPLPFDVIPTITMPEWHAQELMNVLWNAGLRPTCEPSTKAEVSALKNHVGDLRRIAFSLLKIEGGEK